MSEDEMRIARQLRELSSEEALRLLAALEDDGDLPDSLLEARDEYDRNIREGKLRKHED